MLFKPVLISALPACCRFGSKARAELGWEPRPVEDAVREAARFWVGLRKARQAQKSAG